MLPIEILAYITKISNEPIALKIMSVFNIKDSELFIDMLVEKRKYSNFILYGIRGFPHYRYGPAIEYSYGTRIYYQRCKLHRTDGPAIECANGTLKYYKNGLLHRLDGPAIKRINRPSKDPIEEWYRDGLLHRENGPALIYSDGSQKYYENGLLRV